jgi:hypothetical protein
MFFLLASATAHAQIPPAIAAEAGQHGDPRARWTLALNVDSVFYTSRSYDLFDDDNVAPRVGLWAGYDLAQLSPRVVFAVELGFGAETQEQAAWQGALGTQLESQTFSAGASVRYAWLSWLDPQLRASGGVTRLAFELTTDDNDAYEADAVSGFAALGAGFLVHTPARMFESKRGEFASLSLGFLIEGGYALRSSVEVEPSHDRSAHAIAIAQTGLGTLALSGPYVRSSVLVRF